MQRELLSVGPVALAVADPPAASPACSEQSGWNVCKVCRCSDWKCNHTPHQSNTVTQRYSATRQALKADGYGECNQQQCHLTATWELRSFKLTATRSCAVMLSYQRVELTQRSIRDHQYVWLHRNEESAKQAAYCCSCWASGSSSTQPCSIVPLGRRNILVWQDPRPKRKHAISDQRESPNPQPQAAETSWGAATAFFVTRLLSTVVSSSAACTAIKSSVIPKGETGQFPQSNVAAACSSDFFPWRLIRAAKGHYLTLANCRPRQPPTLKPIWQMSHCVNSVLTHSPLKKWNSVPECLQGNAGWDTQIT